ncbi:hypothetical protein LXA43DRAFT_1003391 [Ganoderma leucocontextum]|nr:hypothetical protein LXA43DRAFT_1003391 [Ganoderma leucocontextum]
MPLQESPDPATPAWAQDVKSEYLIIYSSRDDGGKLWCPDCVAVEGLVKQTFEPETGPSGTIVYVGQRSEWKTASNPFRAQPWNVQSIPTVIRIRDGARLVDAEISGKLHSFVQQ